MRIVHKYTSSLAIILISIDLNSSFDCLPNGNPIPGVTRPGLLSSASETNHHLEGSLPSSSLHSSGSRAKSSSPAERPQRTRSKSSPRSDSFKRVFGHKLEDFRYLRLIRKENPNHRFLVKSYTFPHDKSIYLRGKNNALFPMPTEEQVVLSKFNGDISAIFKRNNTLLRAIYTVAYDSVHEIQKRVKVNMYSGAVEDMTPEEINDCPIGAAKPLSKSFSLVDADDFPPEE